MAVYRDKETGEFVEVLDSGEVRPIEEPGLFVQAQRQLRDIGSGIKGAYGHITDQPELIAAAEAETAERNRIFAGADAAYPWQSMIGQALPGLATAPITGGSSLVGQIATNVGIGAAESALDMGQGGTYAERAAAGAIGGLVGDQGSRLAGRILNGARGLYDDIMKPRLAPESPLAARWEELGGETLASQRMQPGSARQGAMERLEQGASSSILPPAEYARIDAANQKLVKDAALESVGLDAVRFDDLGPDTLREASDTISDKFGQIAADAAGTGPINISDDMAERLASTGQIPKLLKRGEFAGLDRGVLSGDEWNVARRALAQDANNAAAKGEYELAQSIHADMDFLDSVMEQRLGPDMLPEYARVREQYRNLQILQKSGVVKTNGEVSVPRLKNALSQGTGYGDVFKQGRAATNPETDRLLEIARVGGSPEFAPFRSSGTAENQAMREMAGMIADPTEWAAAAGTLAAPLAVGVSSKGGGRAVGGLATPAPVPLRAAGGMAGRSLLDEMFYPFVGADDDRPQ